MKLFVATPMYGGQCYGAYTNSLIGLARLCDFEYYPLFNESHIDRARNVCVDAFLHSKCTHLFFIDADIQFRPLDAMGLFNRDLDIVCGFYPKKTINWNKVIEAVKLGYKADVLERMSTELVFTPALDCSSMATRSIYDLAELHEGGTGFMCIRRNVFETIREKNPHLVHRKTSSVSETITCFFDAQVDPEPYPHFLSEDYAFCRLARLAGFKILLAPWIPLTHHGYWRWVGDIQALSKVALKEAACPSFERGMVVNMASSL